MPSFFHTSGYMDSSHASQPNCGSGPTTGASSATFWGSKSIFICIAASDVDTWANHVEYRKKIFRTNNETTRGVGASM